MTAADSPSSVIVLGAGLAAAGFARRFRDCTLFEAAPAPGGYARSHEFAGAWFDQGAHICHAQDPDWLSLVCGHAPLNEMNRSVVLNHKAGHWFSYPVQNHLYELPPDDCRRALEGFLEAQRIHVGKEPRNYEEWCRFQYGDFLLENFYRLYTAKYWHAPMDRMAVDWLGGRLLPSQVENILAGAKGPQPERQAVFRTFRYPRSGGFFALVAHLFDGLDIRTRKQAVRVDLRARVVDFADGSSVPFATLVSSIPLPALVAMLDGPVPDDVREAAARLRHVAHVCVNFVVDRPALSPANWFYVYDPDIPVSRVSFPDSLSGASSGRTPVQAEAFFPMGATPSLESVRDQALRDMSRILSFPLSAVVAAEAVPAPVSYVRSDLGRAAAVETVRSWLRTQGIETMGLFGSWSYVWSVRAFADGADLAARLLAR